MTNARTGFTEKQRWIARSIVLSLLIALPFVVGQTYVVHVVGLAMIAAINALALQLLLGYAGQLSIGQAAFFGIGAYTSGILTTSYNVPFVLAFLASGIAAAVSSLLLAPITRLQGVYMGVATLGFTIIVHSILLNEEWLTGGPFGLLRIPWPSIGPLSINSEARIYFLCLAVLAAVYLAFSRLVHSRFGRGLQAIMLDEEAARACGVNITLYKSKCFFVAALVTGFAGSLFAHHSRYLNPDDFTFWRSIEILVMTAVGGIGSLPGAVFGAFVIVLLPEYLRAVEDWRLVIYGVIVIVLMGLGKGGIAGIAYTALRHLLARFHDGRQLVFRRGSG